MNLLAMPNLQIRDLPEDIYQALAMDARSEHRSLTQQAIVELREAQTARRQQRGALTIRALRESGRRFEFGDAVPEVLVREDRRR